jgi:hypothetical protein
MIESATSGLPLHGPSQTLEAFSRNNIILVVNYIMLAPSGNKKAGIRSRPRN